MSVQQPDTTGFLFDQLPALLRQRGFILGIEEYLRMQELLDRAGLDSILWDDGSSPRLQNIRSFLCPLFAKSNDQQEIFYQVFDEHYAALNIAAHSKKHDQEIEKEHSRPKLPLLAWWWPYLLAASLILATALGTYLLLPLFTPAPPPPLPPTPPAVPMEPALPELSVEMPAQLVYEPTPAGPQPKVSWYDPFTHLWSWLFLPIPLLFFLAHQVYRPIHHALLRRGTKGRKPPYSWPLEVKAPLLRHLESELFYLAARNLRRRELGNVLKLDLRSSVVSTLRAGGYPTLRYKPLTRRPEYLILVQRASEKDHLSQLYGELMAGLEREAVQLRLYFFQTDPRLVTEARSQRILSLADLEKRFADHRLLVFGEPGCLLHPVTGRLAEWAASLETWPRRALFAWTKPTPLQFNQISTRGVFPVLPAVVQGLEQLQDHHFEFPSRSVRVSWLPECGELPLLKDPAEGLERLRVYLGPAVFQWLCACAVYPEIQWELTLHLGSLSAMEPGLLTEPNLLRLLRLGWFRQGSIPDFWRQALITELEPSLAEAVKAAIVDLFERSPAQPGTYAELARQLQVTVYRSERNPLQRRLLRPQLERLLTWPPGKIVQDHVLLRFLEKQGTLPGDLTVAGRFLERVYPNGIRAFGWSGASRVAATVLTTCVIAVALVGSASLIHTHQAETIPAEVAILALEIVDQKNQGIDSQVSVDLALADGRRYQNDVRVNRALHLTGIQVSGQTIFQVSVRSQNVSAEVRDLLLMANQITQQRVELPVIRSASVPRPKPPDQTQVVTGSVVDASNKQPIAGALVELGVAGSRAATLTPLARLGAVSLTGRKGDFRLLFPGAPSSPISFKVDKEGYQSQTFSVSSAKDLPSLVALRRITVADASLTVEPTTIERGQAAELRWVLPRPYRATIEPGIGEVTESGSRRVNPEVTTIYTMTISRPLGVLERKATIIVSLASQQQQGQQQQNQQTSASAEQADTYVDSSAGLMWTKKDNGQEVDWNEAEQYCQSLTLGGYFDWRLPPIDELDRLRDSKSGNKLSIRKPFELTGHWVWSSTKGSDSDYTSGIAFSGRLSRSALRYSGQHRALCVRGWSRQSSPPAKTK